MASEKALTTTEDAEKLLIEAARQDPGRFADLYEANFHRVYAFIAGRVHDRAEAEDLTADVFHRALANLHRFEWRGTPFVAWLYRIAANAIADRGHRQAMEQNDPDLPDPPDPADPPEARLDDAVDALARCRGETSPVALWPRGDRRHEPRDVHQCWQALSRLQRV